MSALLEVNRLRTCFLTEQGPKYAVDDVSFSLGRGETLGIVGESGCGKSVTSLSVMRLLPKRLAKITQGEILFEGEDLVKKSEREMQRIRGQPHFNDFSGADDVAQSCLYKRLSNYGSATAA